MIHILDTPDTDHLFTLQHPVMSDDFFRKNSYTDVREIPTKGICALQQMCFTTGLFCKINPFNYAYRYCYHSLAEARDAIETWDGEGHPPGNWIKRKGQGDDLPNPNYEDKS